MESELEKYRKKKQQEAFKNQIKTKIATTWNNITNSITTALLPERNTEETSSGEEEEEVRPEHYSDSNRSHHKLKHRKNQNKHSPRTAGNEEEETEQQSEEKEQINRKLYYIQLLCKIAIWLCLFMGFLKLEIGAIFFILSTFWLIWTNMNTRRKKKDTGPSAYSVFNPNCEAIDGTLKAEHLEKQLLYREVK